MILSDREIQAALDRGSLRITPVPQPRLWTSTALDLTLDNQIRLWKKAVGGVRQSVCPADKDFNFNAIAAQHTDVQQIPDAGYDFAPEGFILGWTVEKIQLPPQSRLAARVEGKSSLARLGLGVHVTAPTIHAGFGYKPDSPEVGQPIQLEIWNIGPLTIRLTRGMPICQLIFEEVHGTPDKGYTGHFAQQGPSGK